jgi:hypothetical protein
MKKKFLNIIQKSHRIKNRFKSIVGGKRKGNHHNENHHNHHDDNELDDHNDSSNWSYA